MTKSLVPRVSSPELVFGNTPRDQASATLFTTLPRLVVDRANLPTTARQLAGHLSASEPLFERGGQVVRIIHGADGPKIERLNAHGVVLEAHNVCRPVEHKLRQGMPVREDVTLPASVAQLYLAMGGDWDLPVLKGICCTPLLSGDGSISCSTGYNKARGLWCLGSRMPQVVSRPSIEDAKASLQLVRRTFASFPFADSVRVDTSQNSSVDITKGPAPTNPHFWSRSSRQSAVRACHWLQPCCCAPLNYQAPAQARVCSSTP